MDKAACTVSARFMRQDFFEYVPQFKLSITGNHRPGLRSVDEAIRRRFHLVPFKVTIPTEQRDIDLGEKLKAEWPGILAWLIEGCLQWQEIGLRQPQAVIDATKAYRESEDAITAWIDEKCERNGSAWDTASNLYASWKTWAVVPPSRLWIAGQFRISEPRHWLFARRPVRWAAASLAVHTFCHEGFAFGCQVRVCLVLPATSAPAHGLVNY
jgi:hypothetical protein